MALTALLPITILPGSLKKNIGDGPVITGPSPLNVFFRSTIDINGFSMVFPNSGAMVSDGFDLEKDLKMRVIVTDPILRQLCVLFWI